MKSVTENTQKREIKRTELVKVIGKSINEEYFDKDYSDPFQIYSDFTKCGFVALEAPLVEGYEGPRVGHVIFDSFKSFSELEGGRTIKPGNIVLNLRKLIDSIPTITALSVSMAVDIPILRVCSALSLWKEIRDVMTVETTRMQSIVIIALWKFRDHRNHIYLDYGYDRVNYFCETIGEEKLSWEDYNKIVDELLKLQCIDIREEVIWLRESIQKVWE